MVKGPMGGIIGAYQSEDSVEVGVHQAWHEPLYRWSLTDVWF